MKTQSTLLLILMSLLTTLVSCGGGQSSATLAISRSFVMEGSNYQGGLLVHASNATGQNFTLALSGDLEKTIKLDNGSWTFVAIGWSGSEKFQGTKQCALAKQEISANAVIDLVMKETNCTTTTFQEAVKVREFKTITCGLFKTYNKITNTYSDISPGNTSDLFCNELPMELRSELSHYRIEALEVMAGKSTPGFESGCFRSNPQIAPTLPATIISAFPVSKFPFVIKGYRTEKDCLTRGTHQTFNFPRGIEAGNPDDFDHLAQETSTIQTRLILPSSISKRGTSLFTHLLPQFLCGPSGYYKDCFESPAIYRVIPMWYGEFNSEVIVRNVLPTAPMPASSTVNNNFSITNAFIQDGNLFATFVRNETNCPEFLADYCTDTLIYEGQTITIKASRDTNQIYLFEEALDIIGLRSIAQVEDAAYLFHSLRNSDDDIPEGGGVLSDVVADFSSAGIFSLIRTGHKTCQELAQAVKSSGPMKLKPAIVNHYSKGRIYEIQLQVSPSTTTLPLCTGNCTADLKINFTITANGTLDEKGVSELRCDRPVGTYELAYLEEGDFEHEKIIWDTSDMATAQYELYSYDNFNDETYSKIVKAKKINANDFWARKVQYGIQSEYSAFGSVVEMERASSQIKMTKQDTGGDNSSYFNVDLLTNESFGTTEANHCIWATETNLFATNQTGCFLTGDTSTTHNGFPLRLDALINTPVFLEQFTLR